MRAAVYAIFFVSGVAGLVYQISWSRQIGLLLGHTAQAAAVVLGAFFAGLALGNRAGAFLVRRVRRPLAGYAACELVVAAWALAVPALLAVIEGGAFLSLVNHPVAPLRLLVRAGLSLAVLLPATVALGATLPFVSEWASPARAHAPRRAATAYAINTAGGFVGVVLATFVLLLFVGVRGSAQLAAALSVASAAGAIVASRFDETTSVTAVTETGAAPGPERRWYVVAVVSGAATLGLEVLYVRLFALTFHNSTYTFGCVVAVFLAALALGGAIVGRVGERVTPRTGVAVASVAGAVSIPVTLALFRLLTGFRELPADGDFAGYLGRALGLVALVVLPPVTALGCVLPFTWLALARGTVGSGVGRLAAVNTLAAAAGALAFEFLLFPAVGVHGAFAVTSAVYGGLAVVLVVGSGSPRPRGWKPAVVVVLAIVAFVAARGRVPLDDGEESLRQWSSPYGVFDVTRRPTGGLNLRQNYQFVHGASDSHESESRQAHLPLLLHPAPRKVLFLGLGTGITAGASLDHPEVQELEVVELVPEVVAAARMFETWNRGLLDDTRARVVVNDARHHLAATPERYDAIVADLFFPWHSQTGYLYTVEHYRSARAKLAPGGLFAQWLALYQIGPTELDLIADTFASVFPTATLWRGEFGRWQAFALLVGTEGPVELDAASLEARLETLRATDGWKDTVLGSARDVLDLYVGDWHPSRPRVLNTDEHPRVEFLAPVSHGSESTIGGRTIGAFYRSRLERLPAANLRWVSRRGEAAPDPVRARMRQLGPATQRS